MDAARRTHRHRGTRSGVPAGQKLGRAVIDITRGDVIAAGDPLTLEGWATQGSRRRWTGDSTSQTPTPKER